MSMFSKLKTMISQTVQESWQKVNDSETENKTIIEYTPIVNNISKNDISIDVDCKDEAVEDVSITSNIEKSLEDNLPNIENNNVTEEIIEDIHLDNDIVENNKLNIDEIPNSITENSIQNELIIEEQTNENNHIFECIEENVMNETSIKESNIEEHSKFVHTEGVSKVTSSKPFSTNTLPEINIYEQILKERPFFPKWDEFPSFIFEPYKTSENRRRYGPFKEIEQISILRAIENENKSPAKRIRILLKKNMHRLVMDSFTLNLFLDKQECKRRFRLRYPLLLKIDRSRSLKEQIRYGRKTRYSPREQYVINGEIYLLTNDIFYYNADLLEEFFGLGMNAIDAMDEFLLSELCLTYIDYNNIVKKEKASKYMGEPQDKGI